MSEHENTSGNKEQNSSETEETSTSNTESARTEQAEATASTESSTQPGTESPQSGEQSTPSEDAAPQADSQPEDSGQSQPPADVSSEPSVEASASEPASDAESSDAASSDAATEGDDSSAQSDESSESQPANAQEGGKPAASRAWRPPRLSKEEMKEVWDEITARKNAGEQLELEVVGHNRGGVVTQYKGIEVFIPMSHWSLERTPGAEVDEVKVGGKVSAGVLDITDFETDARRVTGTRRSMLRDRLLTSFEPGQRINGRVSTIHDFGAFVDLGGIDGLVHASEISYARNRRPSELLKVGEEVEVVVKDVDTERERIYLGMKELGDSPWSGVEERFTVGETYKGKVAGFTKTGAFVELEPGVEGFIRLRELSWTKRTQRPREVLRKGQEIDVRVLDVSERKERLGLSYREAQGDPWPELVEKFAVGTTWQGEVKELSNKGVVLDVGDVEGFLPRGRMGKEAKRLPDMNVGDKLEVNVIEVNAEKHSLIFGLAGAEAAAPRGGGSGGSGGARGPRGDKPRGERRDRRDRDRAPAAPVKPSNEIKEAGKVGSFSIGDMLGEAIKRQLGVEEQQKIEQQKKEAEAKAKADAADKKQRASDESSGGAAESDVPTPSHTEGGIVTPQTDDAGGFQQMGGNPSDPELKPREEGDDAASAEASADDASTGDSPSSDAPAADAPDSGSGSETDTDTPKGDSDTPREDEGGETKADQS